MAIKANQPPFGITDTPIITPENFINCGIIYCGSTQGSSFSGDGNILIWNPETNKGLFTKGGSVRTDNTHWYINITYASKWKPATVGAWPTKIRALDGHFNGIEFELLPTNNIILRTNQKILNYKESFSWEVVE